MVSVVLAEFVQDIVRKNGLDFAVDFMEHYTSTVDRLYFGWENAEMFTGANDVLSALGVAGFSTHSNYTNFVDGLIDNYITQHPNSAVSLFQDGKHVGYGLHIVKKSYYSLDNT